MHLECTQEKYCKSVVHPAYRYLSIFQYTVTKNTKIYYKSSKYPIAILLKFICKLNSTSSILTFLKHIWFKSAHTVIKLLELVWSAVLSSLVTPVVVVVTPTTLAAEPPKLLGDLGQFRIDDLKKDRSVEPDFVRRTEQSRPTCLASVSTETKSLACLKLEGVKKA